MSAIAQPWLISKYVRRVSTQTLYPGALPLVVAIASDNVSWHRFFDPIFAVCVGVSAAALRIRREEKRKYPDENNDYSTLWAKGMRMGKGYFGGYHAEK